MGCLRGCKDMRSLRCGKGMGALGVIRVWGALGVQKGKYFSFEVPKGMGSLRGIRVCSRLIKPYGCS